MYELYRYQITLIYLKSDAFKCIGLKIPCNAGTKYYRPCLLIFLKIDE